MKTLEQVSKEYKSNTLDGRDVYRLAEFIPFNMLGSLGLTVKEGITEEDWNKEIKEWSRENIIEHLKTDLEFAFEKALNKRGISASFMFEVIRMWNWILEEGLENWDEENYALYGLPLFKATAIKYGFDNPIGEDTGKEDKYND